MMDSGYATAFFSSEEMEDLFQEVFGPVLVRLGFDYVGKIRWMRETRAGFKHLFYFYPFRPGADYYPYAALSFDYVPRIEAGRLRLRPSAKHTRVHLVVSHTGFGSGYSVGRSKAEAKERCTALSQAIVTAIERVLKPIQTPSDALESFRRYRASQGASFYHYPETALSYAFTLAKAGCRDDAETELATVLQKQPNHFPSEMHEQMRSLLATV